MTRLLPLFFTAVLLSLFLSSQKVCAQDRWKAEWETSAAATTSGELPFWFHSNNYGIYDPSSSNLMQRLSVRREADQTGSFDAGFGIDAVGRLSDNNSAFFHELYGELRWGALELFAGKKEWRDGVWSSDLSIGSMIWSGNAATMPKVMLQMPDYASIPYTNRWVAFRGYWGHGWFGDDRFVKGSYLHEKAFYLRFMPEEATINAHVGLIHNVQWGGEHPDEGTLPASFSDYLRIVTGRGGEEGSALEGEVLNALGNTVAAYDTRLDVNTKALKVTAYKQFYIESRPGIQLRSPWDGIWGLQLGLEEATGGWIRELLWEHLNTKRQDAKEGEAIGADQYYVNTIYTDGWTYKGRTLGSPLVTLGTIGGRLEVVNNIILAHHLGMEGRLPLSVGDRAVSYQIKATYSRNYGRTSNYSVESCDGGGPQTLRTGRQDQWYYQLRLNGNLSRRAALHVSAGWDTGERSDQLGFLFGIRYQLLGQ